MSSFNRSFRNRLLTLLIAVVSFAVQVSAQAPAQSASAKLASIAATGSVRFQAEQIAQATGLKTGDTITRDDLQRGADRLVALGAFATVHYRFSSVETGVKVEYQVTDSPTVPVTFDNFPWLTDTELVTELKSTVFLFDGAAPEHGGILDEMSTSLEKLLERHGVFATVKYEVATSPTTNHDVVQFSVEGAGLNVKTIEFDDAIAKADRGIRDRLSDLVDKPFSRSAIETFEAEQVRPVYLARGLFEYPICSSHRAPGRNTHAQRPESG